MNTQVLEKLMRRYPHLTNEGVGVSGWWCKRRGEDRVDRHRKARADLLERVDRVDACCEWLAFVARRKTVNPFRSSYGFKHMAELEIGYVTNGVFVAAALHLGFAWKDTYTVNCLLGISEAWAKAFDEAHRYKRRSTFFEDCGPELGLAV
ncbi:MAG: hypothetical protein Q8L55_02505 [Phycisphaerales bacterium]|nr:hypothetical protein [Phycisphaerales bacterium]